MKFDKAYVISLDESLSRREQFMNYCKRAKLAVEHFSAINGRELERDSLLAQNIITEEVRTVQSGTLGTMLSHIGVWERLLKSDSNVALVFEDDTIIPKKFLENLESLNLGNHNDSWDMIYLGWNKLNCTSDDGIWGVPIKDGYGNTGQFGYIIHRRGVEKIQKLLLPYTGTPHDLVMRNNFDKFNALFLMKPIIDVHRFRFPSVRKDINNRKESENFSLKEKVIRWFRK